MMIERLEGNAALKTSINLMLESRRLTHSILLVGEEGLGAGFVPEVLNTGIYDEVVPVTDENAFAAGRLLGRSEGVLAGISSGAALWAALEQARRPENGGRTVVVLLPDTGERSLSTPMFAE